MVDPSGFEAFWFCAYTPLEILDAAGFTPRRLLGDKDGLEEADSYLHPAFCPYVRACLVEGLKNPTAHAAIFVNACDGMRRLHDAWKRLCGSDFIHLLDFPRRNDIHGLRTFQQSLSLLIDELEKFTGKRITLEDLRNAVNLRKEVRRHFHDLSQGSPGSERLKLAQKAQQLDPEEFLKLRAEKPWQAEGIPLVITGNLLNPSGLVALVEEHGVLLVGSDLCNGERPFMVEGEATGDTREELISSLAEQYLRRRHCARMSDAKRRHNQLLHLIREREARGVIYASLKFCDSYIYDYPLAEKFLGNEGIPLLRLESDYQDGHAGQLSTRIEAFVEMLRG